MVALGPVGSWILGIILLSSAGHAQVSQNSLSESPPRYELGAGLILLNIPNYPGSNNNRLRAIPFPYYIYRGEFLRADDEGTRARILSSKRHETGLSFSFNFPVKSSDEPIRESMPNLDAVVAVGPRVLFRFLTHIPHQRLNLSFATRAVFSSKFSFDNLLRAEGLSFEPRVSYWYRWERSQSTLFSSLGVEFASAKYNRYFYEVPDYQATASRPTYNAKAGLVESTLSLGLGQRLSSRFYLFTSASVRNFSWSANKKSPLVQNENNLGFILGLIWTFYESEEKVTLRP